MLFSAVQINTTLPSPHDRRGGAAKARPPAPKTKPPKRRPAEVPATPPPAEAASLATQSLEAVLRYIEGTSLPKAPKRKAKPAAEGGPARQGLVCVEMRYGFPHAQVCTTHAADVCNMGVCLWLPE